MSETLGTANKAADPQSHEPQEGSSNDHEAQDNNDKQQSDISHVEDGVDPEDIEIAVNSPDKRIDSQQNILPHSDVKKNTNYSVIEENQSPQQLNIASSIESQNASNNNANSINPSQAGPSHSQMKKAIIFLDNAFVYEKVLLQMKSVLFRISTLEFLCFFFNILWFARKSSHIWYNIFYLFHVARSIFGLQISSRLPWSYQIIDEMNLKGNQQEQIKFEEGHKMFAAQLKKQIANIIQQTRLLTRLYMLFTMICLVLDLVSWFIWFGSIVWDLNTLEEYGVYAYYGTTVSSYQGWYQSGSNEANAIASASQLYPEFMFFVLTSVYIAFDLYYLFWVILQKSRMPNLFEGFDKALMKAMLGGPTDLLMFYDIEAAPANQAQAQARKQNDKNKKGNKPQTAAGAKGKQQQAAANQRGPSAGKNQNQRGVR